MKETRLQWLRPDEVLAAQAERSVVYVPLGPIEWHGPHLPLGTDPLQAEAIALALAERAGGVVHPPLFWGTDQVLSPEMLCGLGFKGHERIVGMNFPSVTLRSFYYAEEQLALVVRWTVENLVRHGFRLVVIVNGHGAGNQGAHLRRLAEEFSSAGPAQVLVVTGSEYALSPGDHAGVTETSAMLNIDASRVDLAALPPPGQPLHIPDWAIADGDSFGGQGMADHTVAPAADPRRASIELGQRNLAAIAEGLAAEIEAAWQALALPRQE